MSRIYTEYFPSFLSKEIADYLYIELLNTVDWVDGIKGKKGVTRLAKTIKTPNDIESIGQIFLGILDYLKTNSKLNKITDLAIFGLYLNYYRNGYDHAPKHSHPGTCQIIISLGATRTLNVGTKSYSLNSGDMILFGSSMHEVPIESEVKDGRISIATFSKFV